MSGVRVIAHQAGHSGRPLPTWTCAAARPTVVLEPEAERASGVTLRDLSAEVPGCFQLLNVLSREECGQLTAVTEAMGFDEDAPVSLPHSFRHMENAGGRARTNTF